LKDWYLGKSKGEMVSMGVISEGQYGIQDGLVFSYPCKLLGNFEFKVVTVIDNFIKIKKKTIIV
jgi:malate dehydrogenase